MAAIRALRAENARLRKEVAELDRAEVARYSRQLLVPEFGIAAQRRLRAASALVVGCGGLGSPAALYLAAAGLGCLGLADHDKVELSNLQRQIMHGEASVGTSKSASARKRCSELNAACTIREHACLLTADNALDIIKQYDLILDATDNVATRYLLNDACALVGIPLVSGSALRMSGQVCRADIMAPSSLAHYDNSCLRTITWDRHATAASTRDRHLRRR